MEQTVNIDISKDEEDDKIRKKYYITGIEHALLLLEHIFTHTVSNNSFQFSFIQVYFTGQ